MAPGHESFLNRLRPSTGPKISITSSGMQRKKIDKGELAESLSPVRMVVKDQEIFQIRGHMPEDISHIKKKPVSHRSPEPRSVQTEIFVP